MVCVTMTKSILLVVWSVMGKHGQSAALHFVQSHHDYANRAQWRLRRSVVQQLIVCVLRGVVLWVCFWRAAECVVGDAAVSRVCVLSDHIRRWVGCILGCR
jgi:hypothetical protein